MNIARSITAFLVVAAAAVAAAGASGSGTAGITVVAKGLDNPRGLEVAPSGAIYVAEAGKAGRCVGEGDEEICVGYTGAVTRIAGRTQRRVVSGLLSVGDPSGAFAVGADDIALGPAGRLWAIMADAPIPRAEVRALGGRRAVGQLGHLLRLNGGQKRSVAWVGGYEFAKNPDRRDVNPNPYAVVYDGRRTIVADAGANTVYAVSPAGRITLLAVLPQITPGAKGQQSVPTSLAIGPDRAIYVGELGGEGPGAKKNAARVWRLAPGKKPTVYAKGFNSISGIAFDADGNLYVAQLVNDFAKAESKGDFRGMLLRVARDGTRTELAKGKLNALGGVAIGPKGEIYVSVWSLFAGRGQVVRVVP